MVWERVGSIDSQYVVAGLFQVEHLQHQNAGHMLVCTRISKNTQTHTLGCAHSLNAAAQHAN